MRAALLVCLALFSAVSAHALPSDTGRIVQGKYTASGKATISGITVTYLPSNAHITSHGRVIGHIARQVTSRSGQLLESSIVRLRGNIRTIKTRRGSFTASTVLHIADGAKIRGDFHGLTDPAQKLSRYFKGKISGAGNSNFKLRAR